MKQSTCQQNMVCKGHNHYHTVLLCGSTKPLMTCLVSALASPQSHWVENTSDLPIGCSHNFASTSFPTKAKVSTCSTYNHDWQEKHRHEISKAAVPKTSSGQIEEPGKTPYNGFIPKSCQDLKTIQTDLAQETVDMNSAKLQLHKRNPFSSQLEIFRSHSEAAVYWTLHVRLPFHLRLL